MKVICTNSEGKPDNILFDEWIQEGKVYTVTSIDRMGLQFGKLGFKLEEVTLTDNSFPYEYYDAERFKPMDVACSLDIVKEMFDTLTEDIPEEIIDFGENDADLSKI